MENGRNIYQTKQACTHLVLFQGLNTMLRNICKSSWHNESTMYTTCAFENTDLNKLSLMFFCQCRFTILYLKSDKPWKPRLTVMSILQQNARKNICKLICEDSHWTVHLLFHVTGISYKSLPGNPNGKPEHASRCSEVCSLALDTQ